MGFQPGPLVIPFSVQESTGDINPGGAVNLRVLLGASDGLVAHAGGGQALALPLPSEFNRIITVATSGDSVVLPASAPGLDIVVINHGANPLQVYGLGTDTIDDVAAATGVSQMQNSMVFYTCITAGAWYTEGLATGFGGPGLQTFSSVDNLVAHAGGGQGAATPLTQMQNRITTVATIADSGVLPASKSGMQIVVINAGANSVNVFPAAGEAINALGANTALAVAAGKVVEFFCTTSGQWHTILSA